MSKPSINPTRVALAEAIAARKAAEQAVEASANGEARAFDKLIDARQALRALKEQPVDDGADAFIAALSAGGDADVIALSRPASDRAAQERALTEEIEAWQGARAELAKATAARREAVSRAEFRVSQKALEVVRSSNAAVTLLEGLEAMQGEVARRRSALHFLKMHDLLSDDAKERVAALLVQDMSGDVRRSNPWSLALSELAKDASAKLPEGE